MIKTANLSDEIINLSKELTLIDNVNLPFSSLLLSKGTDKVSSVIVDWKYENLDNTRETALEGADISAFQASTRTTDHNICQIIEKAVSISGTAQAVSLDDVKDLFAHELQNRILEAKRDLEYFLINGVYTEESGSTPRQMKGLVNFVSEANKVTKNAYPALPDINNMVKKMKQAGTSGLNLVMLADYNMTDVINTLFDDKQRYINITNEFGNPVTKINMTYGSAYLYTIDAMPADTMIIANMEYLRLGELRPLQYQELSKTGDSRKGFIVMENTLKVLNPNAITIYIKTA